MAESLNYVRAARQAALRVERRILEMLEAGERGLVGVEVTAIGLQPIQRVEERDPLIKVARGQAVEVETVR